MPGLFRGDEPGSARPLPPTPRLRYRSPVAPGTSNCDVAIVGGGLAGSLIALALSQRRPELDVRLIEAGELLGGNHIWSFFEGDLDKAERNLLAPLVSHAWPGYDVAFPGHSRRINQPYYSIRSEKLDAAVRAALPAARIVSGRRALAVSPKAAVLEDGTRIEAGGVIDARGPASLAALDNGWQKFVGEELRLAEPHGLDRPVVMDATVDQYDGYRFVYLLPFDARTVFVEDTYYSTSATLQPDLLAHRIAAYAEARGWRVESVARRETGVLPVTMGGDFEGYWQAGGGSVAKAGVRAGLFHPTTGYSLPDAVRTAHLVAGLADLSGPALARALHDHARTAWAQRGFYRLLDRMLFRAANPGERYKVLERFYTLPAALIARFYAGRTTGADKLRILSGKPPVPVLRALAVLREARP